MKACYMLALITAAGLAAADASAQSPARQPKAPLFSGDWVGQITVGDSTLFIRARFTDASPSASGAIDVPQRSEWNLALRGVRLEPPSLTFAFVLGADTVRFEGLSGHAGIRGNLLIGKKTGTLELIRRAPYDSVAVRRLAGNYRIAPDRVISMGPMDEVGGWLAFFDSKTRRGGILYALSDSVFFTGPTFGIDYPIAIQAEFRLDAGGHARGLTWREHGTEARTAVRQDDHVTEDVTFQNGAVRLAGTVTVPTGTGRHPAVILIHGAGRTIPTRDFGYWSSYFSGHGVAVLAFDKRGGGASTGDPNTATYEDLADDVLAGLTYLQTRSDIDPRRIGFYGTSNGGYIAPLAAARSGGRVAFITVRSGSARRVGDNIAYEVGNDMRSLGFSDAEMAEAVAIRQRVTDFVVSHPTITTIAWDSLKGEVSAVASKRWYPWSRVLWVPRVSPSDSSAAAYVNTLRTAWQYDPMPYWRKVQVPVYIMLGGLDRSVPSAESATRLREAFAAVGNGDATVRVFEQGNHGLLESRTGYDNEIYELNRYVAGFQDGLIRWIKERAAQDRR